MTDGRKGTGQAAEHQEGKKQKKILFFGFRFPSTCMLG
jgi:hypothetical protein